jgi:hypothetical protein
MLAVEVHRSVGARWHASRMADAGTTDSGLVITAALFGGAGAFLGAVLGQVIGWIREERAEKRVDRRRQEDRDDAAERERRERRHDDYVSVLAHLRELRRASSLRTFSAEVFEHRPEDPKAREFCQESIDKVGIVVKDGFSEALAKIDAVGSQAVINMMQELESHTVTFHTSNRLTNRLNRLRDGAGEQIKARMKTGNDFDMGEYWEEYEVPWSETAGAEVKNASSFLDEVDAIVQQIRKELDLI